MRAAAFPAANDVVPFRDEIRSTPEIQIRERSAEVRHERFDVLAATARLMQGILQQHVGRRELIDNAQSAGLTPEVGKPTANDRLVVALF